jgi:hypothetical protein
VGLERGPLSVVSTTEELLDRKAAVYFEVEVNSFCVYFNFCGLVVRVPGYRTEM